MKNLTFLLTIFGVFTLLQCNSTEGTLTKEYLAGNWYYIDSICDPDPEFNGYNYVEVSFNDSIFIYFTSAAKGSGPTYSRFGINDDSITFVKASSLRVQILDKNKMIMDFDCGRIVQYELTRMETHEQPLKEFWNSSDLDDYSNAVRLRQYATLKEQGLTDWNYSPTLPQACNFWRYIPTAVATSYRLLCPTPLRCRGKYHNLNEDGSPVLAWQWIISRFRSLTNALIRLQWVPFRTTIRM